MPKFGTKNTLIRNFWAGILKNHYHILNQDSQICLTAKFFIKVKILKFGSQNTLFECSGQQV